MHIYQKIVYHYTQITKELKAIVIFGSYARREQTAQSDVDFILLWSVYLRKSSDKSVIYQKCSQRNSEYQ